MSTPPLLIRGARLLDPASGLDQPGALLVRDGLIAAIAAGAGPDAPDDATVIDADEAVLCPGLVDMRASLGEPGFEYRETIASAAEAASAGGITTVACLPDSRPVVDDPALVRYLRTRGEETGRISILPYAAATRGCAGRELAEYGLLCEAGAAGFTDGGQAIADARVMRMALSYARSFGAMIVQHPEDPSLADGGAATEGELATRLGLPGIPAAAEAIIVARDLRLAALTRGHVHFAHVSTEEALGLIRRARFDGIAVTCDTAPPYFDLNETAIGGFRTWSKLSPPLRPEADRLAVVAALADGTIDAVASDHLPRDADDKRLPFAQAAAGGTGLATLLALTLAQVHAGTITLARAIELLTAGPARLLGARAGRLEVGRPADLVLFDLERSWRVEAGKLPGRAQNTPFDGRALDGRVRKTFKAGQQVFG